MGTPPKLDCDFVQLTNHPLIIQLYLLLSLSLCVCVGGWVGEGGGKAAGSRSSYCSAYVFVRNLSLESCVLVVVHAATLLIENS